MNAQSVVKKCDTIFHKNGVISEVICKDSISGISRKSFYDNGNMKNIINYDTKGVMHGLFGAWYENGQLFSECYYEYGYPVGSSIDYYSTGDTMNIRNCINDTCTVYEKDMQGRLKSIEKRRFLMPFEKIVFHSNGNVMFKEFFGKKYLFVCYDSLGNKCYQCWRNRGGAFVGRYEEFYSNGKKSIRGSFLDHEGYNDIKDGKWIFYSKFGRIVKTEYYVNNELMKRRIYRIFRREK